MRGRKTGPYVITNEVKALWDIAPLVGDATLIFRVKDAGRGEPNPMDFEGRRWTGDEWVHRWLQSLLAGHLMGRTYLDFTNEVFNRAQLAAWVRFEIEKMGACAEVDVRCTVGDFAMESFLPEDVSALAPMVEKCVAGKHLMTFNAYLREEDPDRFFYFLPLVERWPTLQWCLKEVGSAADDARYQGPDMLCRLTALVRTIKHPGFRGAAFWCLAAPDSPWGHSNVGNDWQVVVDA